MPSFIFYIIILNGFLLCGGSNKEHACIHDEVCYVIYSGINEMGVAIDALVHSCTANSNIIHVLYYS